MSTATDLLLTRAGDISYRQLDYWVRKGYVQPRTPAIGSGSRRDYGADEERVLKVMGRLVNTVGMEPRAAAQIARSATYEDGCGYVRLGSGLLLKIYGEAL